MSIWIYFLIIYLSRNVNCVERNETDEKYKDMYVIRATTYQVGILTNETVGNNMTAGEEEAVTFYRKNGTDLDLNKIPSPILTNVTGQRVVGVAPVPVLNITDSKPWQYINHIIYGQNNNTKEGDHSEGVNRAKREYEESTEEDEDYNDDSNENKNLDTEECTHYLFKRSLPEIEEEWKKENKNTFKIIQGSAIIPSDAAIKAIEIPPLLTFKNNNLSSIPVPIPNTSVIQYTKINTVVTPQNVQ